MSERRIPLNGTFELTARCNLRCKMCLVRLDEAQVPLLGRERTAAEWIDMGKQVCQSGTLGLLLTGGEPMLRPDFCEIYEALAKMGFILTLYTNATLLTPAVLHTLKRFPPHRIGVTIYGASADTYEVVCGWGGGYEQLCHGLEHLASLPSKLELRTTIIRNNQHDLKRMEQINQQYQADRTPLSISRFVTKSIRGARSDVTSCRLPPEENIRLLFGRTYRYIQEHCQRNLPCRTQTPDAPIERQATLYGCQAGMSEYTISWDGKLLGCQLLSDCWTHPFEEGFEAAWARFPKLVNIPPLDKSCRRCTLSAYCTACPAIRLAETDSLGGCPTILCREAAQLQKMAHSIDTKQNSQ